MIKIFCGLLLVVILIGIVIIVILRRIMKSLDADNAASNKAKKTIEVISETELSAG